MASKRTPEELFPNLFGKQASAPRPLRPEDMRLLQYTMREASRRPASLRGPERPTTARFSGKA